MGNTQGLRVKTRAKKRIVASQRGDIRCAPLRAHVRTRPAKARTPGALEKATPAASYQRSQRGHLDIKIRAPLEKLELWKSSLSAATPRSARPRAPLSRAPLPPPRRS